ncbi:hypothetical protein KAR91_87040 [Candidatus Pacearchaeota archaeon]|nr:hypothetical protein [Candidatus Pacearchaeota archaeon]
MSFVIRATSKESGEQYTVCQPVIIQPGDDWKLRGVMLGLSKKTAALPVAEDANECAPVLMQLAAAFGDRFEFSHVRLAEQCQ